MTDQFQDMPEGERPRERWLQSGPHALNLAELLALLFGTGHVQDSALTLARRLVNEAGSLTELSRFSLEQLTGFRGIGQVKAMRLLASFEIGRRLQVDGATRSERKIRNPQDVHAWLSGEMRFLQKEHFICLFLNIKNVVIGKETLSIGTLDSTLVHPREVFKAAVQRSASSIICVHNHPSGDPTPSAEDVAMTTRLSNAGRIMGIQVIDHVIIGDNRYASLKELGLIDSKAMT